MDFWYRKDVKSEISDAIMFQLSLEKLEFLTNTDSQESLHHGSN